MPTHLGVVMFAVAALLLMALLAWQTRTDYQGLQRQHQVLVEESVWLIADQLALNLATSSNALIFLLDALDSRSADTRLQAVQRMLLRLGIVSTIYADRRPAGFRLMPDGRPLEKHEGPGEKRWGVYVKGTQPDDIHPLGEGWWSPSLPTVTGTRYRISWQSRAEELQPAAGDPRSGPVVFVQWTNDTGQKLVRHYLWGADDSGKPHGKLARKGSYPWTGDGGEVTAPEGATRVRFFFGLRRCKGMVKYRDMHITAS